MRILNLLKKVKAAAALPEPPAVVCSDIDSLMMDRFITAMVDGNLRALVLSGKPGDDELTDAWDTIHSDFVDRIGNSETRHNLKVYKAVHLTISRLNRIELIVQVSRKVYYKKLIDELRKMGFDYNFNPDNKEQYIKELELVITRSKTEWVELQQMKAELDVLMKKATGDEGYTRKFFAGIFVVLEKYMGFELIPASTSVSRYCTIYTTYEKEYEQLKTQKEYGKRSS